jgi:hypothetical protein
MFTVNTSYMHVQAIRRQLKDAGIPTVAKPYYGYQARVNIPTTNLGEIGRDVVAIDPDSYFVWLSTAWYSQTIPVVPNQSSIEPEHGDAFSATDKLRYEWKIAFLGSGRQAHSPEFLPLAWLDWMQETISAPTATTQSEMVDDNAAVNSTWHGWRLYYVEPWLMAPKERVEISVRNRIGGGAQTKPGHLFTLNGVKLFTA